MSTKQSAILVIDDNKDDLKTISLALKASEEFNNPVLLSCDPQEGISLVESNDLLCVFIDIFFSEIPGAELLRKIKRLNPALPVIVLTGVADEISAIQLLNDGASNYLTKNALKTEILNEVIREVTGGEVKANRNLQFWEELPGKLNLVIADSNKTDIIYLRELLQSSSLQLEITECHNREEFWSLNLTDVHCVLMDTALPGHIGLEFMKIFRNRYPYIAVILVTGKGDESAAVDAIKSGAENYLVKDKITAEYLEKSIRDGCEKRALQSQLDNKDSELKKSKASLADANKFESLVFQSFPDYLFVKDSEFRIVKANKAFLSLYPESMRDKVIGYTTVESYPQGEADAFLAMDKKAFATGLSETFETINFPSGELRTLFTTKKRFSDSDGNQFILGVARDVTEREQLIAQLKKSNGDLEEFAYIASHDLKSPLQGILKVVDWIDEDFSASFPEELKAHFKLINSRACRMKQLLDDLLEYSRLNKKLVDYEWFPLEIIQEEVVALVDGLSEFQLEMPQGDVFLPRVAFQIVILNIVANAVKHHPLKSGKIQMLLEEKETSYFIQISDDGEGIEAQYSERIFDMFQTLSPRDELEGSGMGLAIIRKVVSHYGGSVKLSSTSQLGGATFDIVWPKNHVPIKFN